MISRALLVVFLLCTPALASAPGEPADCSDWQFFEPGLSCAVFAGDTQLCNGVPPGPDWGCSLPLEGLVVDNELQGYFIRSLGPPEIEVVELVRLDAAGETVIARLDPTNLNRAETCTANDLVSPPCLSFQAVPGKMLVSVTLSEMGFPPYNYEIGRRIFVMSGFTSVHDLALTYEPTARSFGTRVPLAPEGLTGADRFDVYAGDVTRPLDLAGASPLRCTVPGAAPGAWVPLADLPVPEPGRARYILSTVTRDGVTRAGREAPAGVLHGRDASRLPECL